MEFMKDIEFLKEITDVPGGSGNEERVREILKREISKVTTVQTDAMGNVFGKVGQGPKVIAVGHMDEIGFVVRGITNEGMIQIYNAGFVFAYGQECQIYTICTEQGDIPGVMGRALNQGKDAKFNEVQSVEDELIDIGAKSKQEAIDMGVEVGNQVIFQSHFTQLLNNQLLAKAWDNRIGCAISLRVLQNLKEDIKVTFVGGGTVQEEVGCRGARALAVAEKPDLAISLDTGPACDEDGARIGEGPQLMFMDSCTIVNKKLLKFVKNIAKENNIPTQTYVMRRGGSDVSEMQNISGGAPVLALGVPVKNIHTGVSIISYDDYENAVKLITKVVEALDEDIINDLKSF